MTSHKQHYTPCCDCAIKQGIMNGTYIDTSNNKFLDITLVKDCD